jgi:RNA polymerase sigma-70 factor, ECF subfamily
MKDCSQSKFFELFQPLKDRLIWHLHVMTKDEEEAKDIAGEAVLRAFDHFSSLRDESMFEFFLFQIARREFFANWKRKKLFVRLNEKHENIADNSQAAVESGYDIHLLLSSIASLSERQRETVSLFEIAGLSLEEIRMLQGGSLSGVKTRLVRGRKVLDSLLNEKKKVENSEQSNKDKPRVRYE